VRGDAELAGDLRPECRGQATKALRATTCGTSKVACGRFKATARSPASCRVKPADRCADRPSFQESACSATHCSDVTEWTAGTCLDPRAPGPYGAGIRVVTYTKPSVVNPAMDRVLANTLIWYPTADTGTINSGYNAIVDASVDGAHGPYPVVLFSHGSCGFPGQSVFLTSLLATHGFIVIAPPHPGNTIGDFPSCGSFQAQVSSAQERPQDMIFVLDQILAADADSGSDFFGLVDETAIAMTGHSFGGLTTYLVQAIEPRVTAAMPMAPAAGPASMLTVPSLTMRPGPTAAISQSIGRIRPIGKLRRVWRPHRHQVALQPVDVKESLDELLRLTRTDLIARGVSVADLSTADLPPAMADRVQLQQILLNLIKNACDAMQANPPEDRRLTITTAVEQNELRIGVLDCGVGLPDDTESLFQPFRSTKEGGLGLGLSICRTLVSAHGGRLWGEKRAERGAAFYVALPLALPPEASHEA